VRANLTAAFVHALKPPERGQIDYWDTHLSGFGLRISEGGRKAWTVFYRHRGRLRRLTLGHYPTLSLADARQLAKAALRDAQHGLDPAGAKRDANSAESFADLGTLYLERHAKIMKRTWREDERKIRRELLPRWANRKAAEIGRKDVIILLDSIVARGSGVLANRTRGLISKIFNFGIRRGIVELNPAQGVENPGQEHQRDRVLSEDETRALWHALDSERPKIAAIFRLALLTAQRRGEVLGMRWDELDLEGAWWTIPAERSKNGLAHRVPLGPRAFAILRELQNPPPGPIQVFPGSKGGQPIANIKKPMRRLIQRSEVDFRFHDLRRTAASLMTGLGISRLVVGKILNHVERGVTAIYDRHSYDSEKRAALLKWDRHVAEIVGGRPVRNVIQLQA
jgi:integrase